MPSRRNSRRPPVPAATTTAAILGLDVDDFLDRVAVVAVEFRTPLARKEPRMGTHRFLAHVCTVVVLLMLWSLPAAAQVAPVCTAGPTERLLWHVPRVEHHDVTGEFYGDNYCETTMLVTNLSARTALVQVDFQATGHNRCIQDEIAAGDSLAFATAPMTPIQTAFSPAWGVPGSIVGRANVHASQKEVFVSVHLVCRSAPISSPGQVVAMTSLPAIDRR